MYTIYKITNTINGKIYIGKTTRNIKVRWREHCYTAMEGKRKGYLYSAIRHYGINSFTIEILETLNHPNIAHLNYAEQSYIIEYDTIKNGYNLIQGGNGCNERPNPPLCGYIMPEREKRKRSITLKGHIVSTETRKKISKKNKGKPGRIRPKEEIENFSKKRKGHIVTTETRELLRIANIGQKKTKEVKQKMSEAQKQRWKNRGEKK